MLGIEYWDVLQKIFGAKQTGGKLKIEIGFHELILKGKDKRKTRNGGEMMVLKFWKPPRQFEGLKNPISYHPIQCYHILSSKKSISFKDNWMKRFTVGLDEKSFTAIEKGEKYLCLIQQVERPFEKDGKIMKYEKGNKVGEDIDVVQPEILKVYPPGTNIEDININWFELYKIEK